MDSCLTRRRKSGFGPLGHRTQQVVHNPLQIWMEAHPLPEEAPVL
jgi:hypothetical protein